MQVGNITIRQLFNQDRRYVVPLYQRPYVWQQQIQWEPLWEDIRTVVERLLHNSHTRAHFIGAIVLEYVPQPAMRLPISFHAQEPGAPGERALQKLAVTQRIGLFRTVSGAPRVKDNGSNEPRAAVP